MVCSGTSPDDRLVEIVELPDHPFFVASQYHPEFKSRPLRPQPLFRDFVGAALERARERAPEVEPSVQATPADQAGLRDQGVTRGAARDGREERERLSADFVRLCEIESPSRREREVADAVAGELRACGLDVDEDDSAAATGSDCGNLLSRIPGPAGAPTVLFCAHLDTVPLTGPVEVVREGGVFRNAHEAILGADNKAAVRAARWRSPGATPTRPPPVGIELLLTTCEERALLGAKELDPRAALRLRLRLRPRDAGRRADRCRADLLPPEASFHGAAAHAGIRPEDGRNAIAAAARAIAAMRLGRLDDETTANVGTIAGGTALNVVAERCRVELEARSLDDDEAGGRGGRDGRRHHRGRERLPSATSNIEVEELFRGFRLARTAPPVRRRRGARRARHRARVHRDRRGQRRERADPERHAGAERRQRDAAQPPARRVGHGRRARDGAGPDAGPGRAVCEDGMKFERIASEEIWQGHVGARADRHLPLRGRGEATREIVVHPGAVTDPPVRWRVDLDGPPAARAGRRVRPSGTAGRKAGRRRRVPLDTAKRELAEEIGKGARDWEPITSIYNSPGILSEENHLFLARDLYDESQDSGEEERIEIVTVPIGDLDATIRAVKDAKTLVALLWFKAYLAAR